jgi:hypothetical protein
MRWALWVVLWLAATAPGARAQLVTVGGGALATERATEAVAELHAETPPLGGGRAYATLSWSDQSAAPTVITAWEHPVVRFGRAFTGLGAGLLWLEAKDYQPDVMLVSSTVIPLPIPRTSFVFIASTSPFEDFDWSLVFKVGVTAVFIR